jgi:hypothetical protein
MSNSWYGGIPYDASNSTHRRLLELDNSSIVVDVRPEKIVFVDGTVKTFSQKDAEGD